MELKTITENICFLPASENPLSSDVVFIKENNENWIFDTGHTDQARDLIEDLNGKKNIVISHFHEDHTYNLNRITYDNLYLSSWTFKKVHKGTIIENQMIINEDFRILTIPSSHEKGCLIIEYKDYAFMGDALYARPKILHHTYNAQLLKGMIECLEGLKAKYFCLSHAGNFIQNRESVIRLYKDIYKRHKAGNPVIDVEDFFNADGSVKE